MKKVIIIGAGITGLSAGINALLKGHKVTIYEKNKFCGGCCNGWYKNGHYIDNSMYILPGTNQHTHLFKQWKKVGGIDETSNLYQSKYLYKSYFEGKTISLDYNTEKVRNDMISLSPEDRKEIDKFINAVNFFIKLNKKNNFFNSFLNKTNCYSKGYFKYHKLSLEDLSKKFKHPLLKKLFIDYYPKCYSSFSLIYTYALFASGNGKTYSNGSYNFVKNLETRFLDLGGEICFNSEVNKINIEKNCFSSIMVNDMYIKGDILISCIDCYHLFNKLLDNNYTPKTLKKKQAYKIDNQVMSSFHCAYAIDKKDLPFKDTIVFDIPNIEIGNNIINRIILKEYSHLDKDDSKTVIQIIIPQTMDDYDYWLQLQTNNINEYNIIKQNIGYKLLDIISNRFKSLCNSIELLDTWTPVTYNNYFNSYYGSYMGFVLKKKQIIKKLSPKINKLKNIYYLSIFQKHIGGLANCLMLGDSVNKIL